MILNQILLTVLKRNVWRFFWRICIWILGLKGLILLYIHVGKKVVVNNLLEIRSCKIVGVYYKILLKLQYNFSSKSYFMGYRKKRLGDFQMNTFLSPV